MAKGRIGLIPQLLLSFCQVTQIHEFFRSRKRGRKEPILGLHLDIHFHAIERYLSVSRKKLVFGEIVDPPAGVGRFDSRLPTEKRSRHPARYRLAEFQ